ncbi:Phosphoenolpyruvate phosphomutase [Allokutzneria albata]|uniref:Phosphoenolpyruvate phosphomutase n=1 Tax=Allokutzneria albata TaxID=211114 RepID=A0A1G9T4S5_ALLAB|nr:isocitrate lyase/phosphoenolpyruvate mutase family protein [Allokutzneria albata]SDM42632.1 Phosphoenolpyruvate phosphomutase [Allokutzneria albata]
MDAVELATTLRELHHADEPLLLPNVWDAASAKAAERAGFPALATTSMSVALTLGYADHEAAPADEMFAAVGRIARAVSVPVTADIEAGYGLAPEEVVDRLLSAGAVGCNLEDTDHGGVGLVEPAKQADRLAAVRAAADAAGVPIVINARADSFVPSHEVEDRLGDALNRGRAYLDAGADAVYPIFAAAESDISALVTGLEAPVNIAYIPAGLPLPATPGLAGLANLGVRRVSFGGGLHAATEQALHRVLTAIRQGENPY